MPVRSLDESGGFQVNPLTYLGKTLYAFLGLHKASEPDTLLGDDPAKEDYKRMKIYYELRRRTWNRKDQELGLIM